MIRSIALFATLALAACATSQQSEMAREETAVRTFQARVGAIDHETRVVTLVNAAGDKLVFRADAAVQNLDQVKVGDVLHGELVEKLLIEARPATDEEKATPVLAAEAGLRAQPGEKPAGVFARELKSVFTVASIDKAAGGGELRDAEGGLHFVKARDPSVLDRLKVGDTVVVTYTEALALEVVPGS
ncbi:MAG: hypothetical protein ABFS41_19750 [Myxococcota bacterium]